MPGASLNAARRSRVLVIGAGIAGLTCAVLLAQRGVEVIVIDRAEVPGGKLRTLTPGGAPIDAGPTVFTMRWVFDEIFDLLGESVDAWLSPQPLITIARHAWDDGGRLDLFAEQRASVDAVGRFAGAGEARRFEGFCAAARGAYAALEAAYIRAPRPTLTRMALDLGPRGLAVLAGLGPFATLAGALARHFRDPRLVQLFGRYATYCGASPYAAPATLMLIAQVEMQGVWSLPGGMRDLPRVLAELARRRGVRIMPGRHCAEILAGDARVRGVRLDGGETVEADTVVFNGDVGALRAGLLGEAARAALPAGRAPQRSLSALTWALHAKTSGFPLSRHNVFFTRDYASEFDDIFGAGRLPRHATVYVCAQDRDNPQPHGGGPERLLVLVNAPATGDRENRPTREEIEACEQRTFSLLQRTGLTVEHAPERSVTTGPAQFERLFPATGGALYGQATHGWMSSFRRPGATTRLPGLLLAGGSVHPGAGVPMAALSGRLAAGAAMERPASTPR